MCDQCQPTRPFRAPTAEENFLSLCDQAQRRAHNPHQAPIWLPRSARDGTDLRKLLTTAIVVLRRDGWRQAATINAGADASCIEGTLCQAQREAGVGDWVLAKAFAAVSKVTGHHYIREWNETPELTQADVEAAITRALTAAGGSPVPRTTRPPMPPASAATSGKSAERIVSIELPEPDPTWQGFPERARVEPELEIPEAGA